MDGMMRKGGLACGLMAAVLLVGMVLFYRYLAFEALVGEQRASHQRVFQALKTWLPSHRGALLGTNTGQADGGLSVLTALSEQVERQLGGLDGHRVALYTVEGRELWSSAPVPGQTAADLQRHAADLSLESGHRLQAEYPQWAFLPWLNTSPSLASYLPVVDPDPFRGPLLIELSTDLSTAMAPLERMQWRLAAGWATGLALFCALLFAYQRRAQRSVQRLLQESRSSDHQARHKAHHDALTGLPNRMLLQDRLSQALRQARRQQSRVVLMLIDLDGFKEVNDTHGHQAGDRLLQAVSKRLTECVREGDTVSRLGGDEFVMLLPLFDSRYQEPASAVAKRALEAVSQPVPYKGQALKLGCSIGIAFFPEDGEEAETLMKHADTAMYRAKRQGKNHFQFFRHSGETVEFSQVALGGDFLRALEEGQIQLLYQPRLDLKQGGLRGVEAHLQWVHPRLGAVDAERLIAWAERSEGLAVLVQWMLERACSQFQYWRQSGVLDGTLSIDLVGAAYRLSLIEPLLSRVLIQTGFPAERLELKLSSGQLAPFRGTEEGPLPRFLKMGGGISIGHFAREASLMTLKELPVHRILIDAGIVGALPDSEVDSALTRAIIALGAKLGIEVVADGVETQAQLDYLKAKGCTLAQGQMLARPLLAEELTRQLREGGVLDRVRQWA